MVAETEIFRQLSILLAVATVSHFVIRSLRQPTIVGEIALGIVLGPTVLGAFGVVLFDSDLISIFASLGAIFLLFLIGLESDFRALYTRKNFFVALGGVLLPFVVGVPIAYVMVPASEVPLPDGRFVMSMFVGATLVATSTAIAASVLLELGLLKDRVAQTIMGAAVVDDVLGLLVLSIVVGLSRGGIDASSTVLLVTTALLFILIAVYVGIYFFSKIVVRIQRAGLKIGVRHGGFLVALAIAFLYSFMAEIIGLSAIVGAFIAGTMFASTPLREEFTEGARYLFAVFTPVFFISIGLLVQLQQAFAAPDLLVFAGAITVAAIVSKLVGCGLPARRVGFSVNESVAVGWGMTPRGEVGLIVALTALQAGVILEGLFSVIVLVMIVVSILPAPMFKRALLRIAQERQESVAAPPTGVEGS